VSSRQSWQFRFITRGEAAGSPLRPKGRQSLLDRRAGTEKNGSGESVQKESPKTEEAEKAFGWGNRNTSQ
jgi:hypothetical protein